MQLDFTWWNPTMPLEYGGWVAYMETKPNNVYK